MHDFYPLTYILHEQYKMLHFKKKNFSLARNWTGRKIIAILHGSFISLLKESLNDGEPCEVQWCVMIMTTC